jgi:dsDNA-binding SOS-regulon protein
MSRSNPTETLTNPAKLFIEWSGSEGKFSYYDKDKKEKVFLDMPVRFIPLDVLSTVKGYDENAKKGYWSNEVRSTKQDVMVLRSKDGVEHTGLYETIKEKFSSKGVDYIQSVYAAFKIGKELSIVNFQLKGSALSPFIEFCKGKKISEIGVEIKSSTPKKKGAVKYFEPVYEVMGVSEATDKQAVELDKELQEYLSAYLAKNKSNVPTVNVTENQDNGLNTSAPKKDEKSSVSIEEDKQDFISSLEDDDVF